ncbi:MAG: transposase [Moorea sp. SIO3G5]|nr:transposase [Moorena sp. SIO3G5]
MSIVTGFVIEAKASGVIPGQDLGISLQAMLAWMENQGNLSEEKQQEWLLELTGLKIGVGTNGATNRRLAQSLAIPIQELWQWAQQQQHLHVDETPWGVAGVKEWLWTVAGAKFSGVPCRRYPRAGGTLTNYGFRICWSAQFR